MSVNFEKTSTNEGVLHFTIDRATAVKGMKEVYKDVKKDVSIPGFRKGKVAYPMYVKMFGEESLYQDALNLVLGDVYDAAIKETGLEVVTQPRFDAESMENGKDWEIKATVATKPAVKLGEFQNLTVSKQDREVSEEEINDRVEAAQSRLSELAIKEDAAVEGDTVVIDYKGFKGEEQFEGGTAENHSLELGSNSFIPGFEEQLAGAKEGDKVEVNVIFPEDYQAEDLAGQAVVFQVEVHEVKEKVVPELDDEFAKDVDDEVETLDALKEKYRQEIKETKENAAKEAIEEEALRLAVENSEIDDLPHEMVHEEVHRQMDHYLNEMKRQGIEPELYYQLTGTTEADLHQQFESDADVRVKTNLILEAIVAQEGLESTDEDLSKEITDLAAQYNMEEEMVRQVVTADMLKNDIALKKAMDMITDTAVEA